MKKPIVVSRATQEVARHLGNLIKIARIERGMTQEELAVLIRVTPVTLRRIERGDTSTSLGSALEAAWAVGVPLVAPDSLARRLEITHTREKLSLLPSVKDIKGLNE